MKRTETILYHLFFKRLLLKVTIVSILLVSAIQLSNWHIESSTANQIYSSIGEVPKKDVALVLGAARYGASGHENPYFTYRMEAAADLYLNGKVQHILVSGDNSKIQYNEPEDMLKKLMELGVPASCVTLDYAGFRTFDSVLRAYEIFGIDDFIIVSQTYHLQRALFIANVNGIGAVGYQAKDVRFNGVNLREKLAKFKAVLDCSILFTSPKFLGDKEPISLK